MNTSPLAENLKRDLTKVQGTLHFCNVPKFGNILYANEGTTIWHSLDFGAEDQPFALSEALKSRNSLKAVSYPIHNVVCHAESVQSVR